MTTLLIPGAMDPMNRVFILSGNAPPTTRAPGAAAGFSPWAEGGGVGTYPAGPPMLSGGGADPIAPGGMSPPGGPPGGPYPGGPALGGGIL